MANDRITLIEGGGSAGGSAVSAVSGESAFTVDAAAGAVTMSPDMKEAFLQALGLASGYTDLQYVRSNGSYVITDLTLNGNYTFTFKGRATASGAIVSPYTAHSSSTMRQGLLLFNTASHKVAPYWPDVSWSDQPVPAAIDFTQTLTIVQDRNGIAISQGEEAWTCSYSGSGATYDVPLYIFGSANPGHADYNAGIFESLTVSLDGGTVARFVPKLRNEDNVAGLYDTVARRFYTSAGGAFIAGPAA